MGHRKLDIKELFCLCGFAFVGFVLWVSLVPVTATPLSPMVSQAIRVRSIRNRIIQVRQTTYDQTGDYGQAVLAVAPDIDVLLQVVRQTSDGWAILVNDPDFRRSGQQFRLGLAAMEDQSKIFADEVVVARMMQQASPIQRRQLSAELERLIGLEQISRERLQEYGARPGI